MPKVLILTGDAAEALEVIYPHQRLREEGYEVVVAGLSRKLLQLVVHEMVPETTLLWRSRATIGRQMSLFQKLILRNTRPS